MGNFELLKVRKIVIAIGFLICIIDFGHAAYKLQERYSWTQLDFAFPNQRLKEQAIASGDYIPQNGLPVGVEHWQNRLFVTVPRWRDGIPATLTYINMDHTLSGSPELIPYPDWRSNVAGDCANSITTAYRIKADECGRLWVLDTGTLGIGNTTTNPCPYAVNVFDLTTNTRIRRYELRADDTNANTFIANIAIDIGKNCDDAYAYFSDELGYGLISYSWEKNKSWRFSAHSFFFPDPLRGDYNVAGLNFQWGEEGIFGMAMSPLRSDGYRTLYFSPLASHREFAVSTRILRDETRVEDSFHDFIHLDERGPNSHTTSHVMSDDGIELFNLIDQNAIGCWHSSMPYVPQYHGIVDRDDVGLVFPADIKIDENQNVWVLSDRMPVFLLSELDFKDVNFRIYTAPLSLLIENTVCDIHHNIYDNKNGLIPVGRPNGIPNFKSPFDLPSLTRTINIPQVKENYLPPAQSQLPKYTPKPLPQYQPQYTTQKVPLTLTNFSPKAYVYNQHNGISYETTSPHHSYNPTGGLRNYQSTNLNTNINDNSNNNNNNNNNWWTSSQVWGQRL